MEREVGRGREESIVGQFSIVKTKINGSARISGWMRMKAIALVS